MFNGCIEGINKILAKEEKEPLLKSWKNTVDQIIINYVMHCNFRRACY